MTWYDEDGKPQKAKCPGCGRETACHNDRCDDYEEPDRKYPADQLGRGWLFRSPAGRMETVERIEEASAETGYEILIWTVETGPGFCWRAFRSDKIEAVRPQYPRSEPAKIVIREWSTAMQARISVAPGDYGMVVAEAHGKRGEGWTVSARLDGREVSIEQTDSKAKARTIIRRWSRQVAKTLGGLEVVELD